MVVGTNGGTNGGTKTQELLDEAMAQFPTSDLPAGFKSNFFALGGCSFKGGVVAPETDLMHVMGEAKDAMRRGGEFPFEEAGASEVPKGGRCLGAGWAMALR